jgi:hypothetical protein
MPVSTRLVPNPHRAPTLKIVMHENASKCTVSAVSRAHLNTPATRTFNSAKRTQMPTCLTSRAGLSRAHRGGANQPQPPLAIPPHIARQTPPSRAKSCRCAPNPAIARQTLPKRPTPSRRRKTNPTRSNPSLQKITTCYSFSNRRAHDNSHRSTRTMLQLSIEKS